MKSDKSSRSRNAFDQSKLCQFSFTDNRQCRMFRHESHASLCLVHAREEQQLLAQDEIGDELESISGEFRTPARRAENLTYLAQLLLYSQKHIRYETNLARRNIRAWQETVRAAYPAPEHESEDEQETQLDEQPVSAH
jgi:hypothetical protein